MFALQTYANLLQHPYFGYHPYWNPSFPIAHYGSFWVLNLAAMLLFSRKPRCGRLSSPLTGDQIETSTIGRKRYYKDLLEEGLYPCHKQNHAETGDLRFNAQPEDVNLKFNEMSFKRKASSRMLRNPWTFSLPLGRGTEGPS